MQLLDTILSLIAPHQCLICKVDGSVLCNWCLPEVVDTILPRCVRCHAMNKDFLTCKNCRNRHGLPKYVWVHSVYGGYAKELLHRLKFQKCRAAARTIAHMQSDTLPNLPNDTVVVHVPTAPQRVRERGFDQSKLLAREFAKQRELTYRTMLQRVSSVRQVGSNREARVKQMKGAFEVANTNVVKKAPILLMDDIYTTGATLVSATKTLKRAGYKNINAVVFAQTV